MIIGDDMETLEQYFSYCKDCDISFIFYQLYKKMKIIHSNGMYVPLVDSTHVFYDGDFSFDSISLSDDIASDKKRNILSLTKLFLGTYLSLSTEFRDFSSVNTDWFCQNMNDIDSIITGDDFLPEYFHSVFLDNADNYYCDFIDEWKKNRNSPGLNHGYKKVLSNSGSKFYQDQPEPIKDVIVEKRAAFINYLFYPVLILSLVLLGFVFYTCFKYLSI